MTNMEYRKISGEQIKRQRGDRSMRAICKAANGAFTVGAFYKWESGKQPTEAKLPHLLNALGCSYEDISVPVSLALGK